MKKFSTVNSQLSAQRGFTLVELLIVIVILIILSGVIVVAINPAKRINQAKDAKIKADIAQIANAMERYYTVSGLGGDNPYYPATVAGLLPSELKSEPKDAAGKEYSIKVTPKECAKCANVAVYHVIYAPTTKDFVSGTAVWCWSSSIGQVTEVADDTKCTAAP